MPKKYKIKKDDFEPPYDGFFTSSVASANESTGYAVTVPDDEQTADELKNLGQTLNTTSKKEKKNK